MPFTAFGSYPLAGAALGKGPSSVTWSSDIWEPLWGSTVEDVLFESGGRGRDWSQGDRYEAFVGNPGLS